MSITILATALIGCWLIMSAFMALAWIIQQRTGNSGWVDVVWTIALATSGIIGALAGLSSELTSRQLLIAAIVAIWALRLVGHIVVRTQKISDDPRYAKMQKEWGDSAPVKMFGLLEAQALLSVPMLLAIILAAWNPRPLFGTMDIIAILVFVVALTGSYISDRQLTEFKNRSGTSGKVCDVGLWSWSRHPNYFFEVLIWLAIALFALDWTAAYPWGFAALLGPACMYVLLRYVSGVPPLEDHMVSKYGDAYRAYQKSTSVFVPLPPER